MRRRNRPEVRHCQGGEQREEIRMFSNGNSYGTSNATGGSCANDLGGGLVTPTPWWFMPVMVWHPRPGK